MMNRFLPFYKSPSFKIAAIIDLMIFASTVIFHFAGRPYETAWFWSTIFLVLGGGLCIFCRALVEALSDEVHSGIEGFLWSLSPFITVAFVSSYCPYDIIP